MVGLMHRRELRGTREASKGGRVRVRIIHGLNISHKELTYLLQKSISYRNKVLRACSQGVILVGKDHRSSPTATRKEDNKKINHAPTSSHNGSPYVHAMGITKFNTSIPQIHNYSTSMTLISPSSYLKTNIKYQFSHSIQCTFYDSFYYTQLGCPSFQDQFYNHRKYHAVLKGSQNNISDA